MYKTKGFHQGNFEMSNDGDKYFFEFRNDEIFIELTSEYSHCVNHLVSVLGTATSLQLYADICKYSYDIQ